MEQNPVTPEQKILELERRRSDLYATLHDNMWNKDDDCIECGHFKYSKREHPNNCNMANCMRDCGPLEETVKIYGSEIPFELEVKPGEVVAKCLDIWNNPGKYDPAVRFGTPEAYYYLTKFLWVEYPDGTHKRIVDIVEENGGMK